MEKSVVTSKILEQVKNEEEVFWINPRFKKTEENINKYMAGGSS